MLEEEFVRREDRLIREAQTLGVPLAPNEDIEIHDRALRYREFIASSTQEKRIDAGLIALPKNNISATQLEFYSLFFTGLMRHYLDKKVHHGLTFPTIEHLLAIQAILYCRPSFHECGASCRFLSFRQGQRYHSTIVGHAMEASGRIFVCLETGRSHNCSPETCKGRHERKELRTCPISGFVKNEASLGIPGDIWTQVSFRLRRSEEFKDWGKSIKDTEDDQNAAGDYAAGGDADDDEVEDEDDSNDLMFERLDEYMQVDPIEDESAPVVRKRKRIGVARKAKTRRVAIAGHAAGGPERMKLLVMLVEMVTGFWVWPKGMDRTGSQAILRFHAELIFYYWQILSPLLYDQTDRMSWEWAKLCRQFTVALLTILTDKDDESGLFPRSMVIQTCIRVKARHSKHGSRIINTVKASPMKNELVRLLGSDVAYKAAREAADQVLFNVG